LIARKSFVLTCIFLVAAAREANAMELDTLLPSEMPGYGLPRALGVAARPLPGYEPIGVNLGDISLNPQLDVTGGYDSSPNGLAQGSPIFEVQPSLIGLDKELGLGGYVSGVYANYPSNTAQNLSGYTVALGEEAVLPREKLTLGAVALATQETGFDMNTIGITKPISVAIRDIRASDAVSLGTLTLTPRVSITHYSFDDHENGFGNQDRTDYREAVTAEFGSGGPARFVMLLHATESLYRLRMFNANTYSALAGSADETTGLLNIRLLAGGAAREPGIGPSVTAPVLEASVDWMPTALDSLTLEAAREIDNPDQESANGYTLTETKLSLAHEYLRNVILTASFDFSHAAYFNTPLIESLYSAAASADWHLNRALAVNARYSFNDRQANYLRAANQHLVTLSFTWTP
jgi:hypothetical protein